MTFTKWIDTLVAEKGINTDAILEVEGGFGTNYIPVECVIEAIKATCAAEQAQIKNTLVNIDFLNGDILDFFAHLAKAIAV